MPDVGIVYGSCRERMTEMVRPLDPAQAATRVAATEEWTVHDVVAHQVGVVSDVNTGNLDGIGTDAWTAAQVDARTDASIADMIAEWEQGSAQFEATITALGSPQGAIAVADIWNHEQDLRGALAVEGGRDPLAEQLAIEGYSRAAQHPVHRVRARPAAAARRGRRVALWRRHPDDDGHRRALRARPPHLWPAHPEQLRSYLWDGDPEPYIAALAASVPPAPLPT